MIDREIGLTVGLVLFLVAGLASVVMLGFLRPHRTDISGSELYSAGRSRIWQANVSNPENYNTKGKRLLKIFHLLQLLAGIGGFVALIAQYQ